MTTENKTTLEKAIQMRHGQACGGWSNVAVLDLLVEIARQLPKQQPPPLPVVEKELSEAERCWKYIQGKYPELIPNPNVIKQLEDILNWAKQHQPEPKPDIDISATLKKFLETHSADELLADERAKQPSRREVTDEEVEAEWGRCLASFNYQTGMAINFYIRHFLSRQPNDGLEELEKWVRFGHAIKIGHSNSSIIITDPNNGRIYWGETLREVIDNYKKANP